MHRIFLASYGTNAQGPTMPGLVRMPMQYQLKGSMSSLPEDRAHRATAAMMEAATTKTQYRQSDLSFIQPYPRKMLHRGASTREASNHRHQLGNMCLKLF
jgi:hypothetical protein